MTDMVAMRVTDSDVDANIYHLNSRYSVTIQVT